MEFSKCEKWQGKRLLARLTICHNDSGSVSKREKFAEIRFQGKWRPLARVHTHPTAEDIVYVLHNFAVNSGFVLTPEDLEWVEDTERETVFPVFTGML
jgi:hypothetical protein